jgi:hypothetical protein
MPSALLSAPAKLNDKTKEYQRILRNRTLRWISKNGCRSLRLAEIPRAMAAFLQVYLKSHFNSVGEKKGLCLPMRVNRGCICSQF